MVLNPVLVTAPVELFTSSFWKVPSAFTKSERLSWNLSGNPLLALVPELKRTYEVLNQIRIAIQPRDWANYKAAFWQPPGYSEEMQATIQTLQEHHDEIHQTLLNHYSKKGPLEGTNNLIKAIKRVGFGYRGFFRFRTRVLYVLRIHTKKALITK